MRTTAIAAAFALTAFPISAEPEPEIPDFAQALIDAIQEDIPPPLPVVSDTALAACQAEAARFTTTAQCLPVMHVAVEMIEAIAAPALLGEGGAEIVEKCTERNENPAAVWGCTRMAIRDAGKLLHMVGDPERIDDPLFRKIADADRIAATMAHEKDISAPFSDTYMSGPLFRPLE